MPIVSHVTQVAIGKLHPHTANVHKHSKTQIAQIVDSISIFGFTAPIIADEDGNILAGHGRWLAAKRLGLKYVPAVVLSGLSDAERRAYILADNKLTENAAWDRAGLAIELHQLAPLLAEGGLDITLTGFETVEIETLEGELAHQEPVSVHEPHGVTVEPISRKGDVWLLGEHCFHCGDSKDDADVAIQRWQNYTKNDAVLKATNQTFAQVSAARSKPRCR